MVGFLGDRACAYSRDTLDTNMQTKSDIDMEKYRLRRFVDRLVTMDEVEISF
jgi:hypothetical protein